jgi:DNA-binding beta-propeller fold protein YncE
LAEDETRDSAPPGAGEIFAGAEFAGHRIVAELGRGGMGVVYRVHDPVLDQDRAMKVIAPALSADPRFRDRFRRESRLAAQVEHPNAIPIYRAGEDGGRLFLVMRLVEGANLRDAVRADGRFEPDRAARTVAAVAGALDSAHARGLVHRDVKPANVLLEPAGEGERVFLTDFGISRSESGGTVTDSGEVMGSIDYAAPEQLEGGDVDRRADVYALGCVAYFTLTGEPPFPRDSDVAKMYAHVHAPRPLPSALVPGLPAAADEAISEAMAIDPDRRPPSAGEFADRLERALAGFHEATTDRIRRRRGAARRLSRRAPPRRRLWLALAAALAIVAAVVVAIVALSGGGGVSPPQVAATIQVGRKAIGVAVGPNAVWVALRSGDVVMIDRRTDRTFGVPIHVGGAPSSIAVAFGSVWVADAHNARLVQIRHHRILRSIPVGARPADVVAVNGFVWVASEGENEVDRIDPFGSPPRVEAKVPVGGGPHALAIGDGGLWAASISGGTVTEINPIGPRVVGEPVTVGGEPADVATAPGAVWVIDNQNNRLVRVKPETLRVSARVKVGSRPRGLAQGLGYVWVANGGDSNVWRVDASTGERVGRSIRVGRDPADVAVGDGSVWTADFAGGTVTRISP